MQLAAERSANADAHALPAHASSLVLDPLGLYERSAVFSDPVLARLAAIPEWAPTDGESMNSAEGRSGAWRAATLDASGKLDGGARSNSWWFQRWTHERDEVLLLEAPGAGVIYADGTPRMGDLYALGIVRVPIAVREGANDVLVRVGRGQPRVAWSRPPAPIFIAQFDRTLPDVIVGEGRTLLAGVVVVNATRDDVRGLAIEAKLGAGESRITALATLLPLEVRKVAIEFDPPAPIAGESLRLELTLRSSGGAALHRDGFDLAVRRATQHHARTFVSRIDSSVQYFAVAPASAPSAEQDFHSLILSLHGASVEARGQAAAYAQKDWCYVIAPTNRRPYGFDWEDWGRRDAIEVLELAMGGRAVFDDAGRGVLFAEDRVHLTGHSMGGHGTWQIGARYADRFAAIAPSAGWNDFWSYAGGGVEPPADPPPDPIEALLHRASNGSRTLLWAPNYAKHGVYVLHGDADDNVPVREARRMREALGKFHSDFAYFEKPGAGHWWGNECVDWPPLMEFLRARTRSSTRSDTAVEVRVVDLDAELTSGFAKLVAQTRPLLASELKARAIPDQRRFEVRTTNVEAFELSVQAPTHPSLLERWDGWRAAEPGSALVDGVEVALPAQRRGVDGEFRLRRMAGVWQLEPEDFPRQSHKHAGASGPFKDAFDHGFVLVYGTSGDAAENSWSLAKARFDADQFRYRGNSSPLIVTDRELLATLDEREHALGRRNLVLYGNAETNAAWSKVVEPSALQVQRGRLRVGAHTFEGADLSVLAVRPHARRPGRLVALVGGTGVAGMSALNHAPYFVSGAGFPDWWIARAAFLSNGLKSHVAAGFFRSDWSVDDGPDTVVRASNLESPGQR